MTDKMWIVGEFEGGADGVVAAVKAAEKAGNEKFKDQFNK
jgi:hypothetical protein